MVVSLRTAAEITTPIDSLLPFGLSGQRSSLAQATPREEPAGARKARRSAPSGGEAMRRRDDPSISFAWMAATTQRSNAIGVVRSRLLKPSCEVSAGMIYSASPWNLAEIVEAFMIRRSGRTWIVRLFACYRHPRRKARAMHFVASSTTGGNSAFSVAVAQQHARCDNLFPFLLCFAARSGREEYEVVE